MSTSKNTPVWVLSWKFRDNSNSGVIAVYRDRDEAAAVKKLYYKDSISKTYTLKSAQLID